MVDIANKQQSRFPSVVSVRLTTKEAQKCRLLERLNALPAADVFPEHPHRMLLRFLELGLRQEEIRVGLPGGPVVVHDDRQTVMALCSVCGGGGELIQTPAALLCARCFTKTGRSVA